MKKSIITMLVLTALASTIFAYGGGGTFYGTNPGFLEQFDNTGYAPYAVDMSGGYGYGVDGEGTKIGGFGIGFSSNNGGSPAGGFGGMLLGKYGHLGPFTVSGNSLLGIGALNYLDYNRGPGAAWFAQLDMEVGLPVFSWFQVSAFGGMQYVLALGAPLESISSMPVAGIRLTWGSF